MFLMRLSVLPQAEFIMYPSTTQLKEKVQDTSSLWNTGSPVGWLAHSKVIKISHDLGSQFVTFLLS